MSQEKLQKKLEAIQALVNECLVDIGVDIKPATNPEKTSKNQQAKSAQSLNYGLNIRAFIKKYGSDLNGPQKFTLMIAYLAKGDSKKEVLLDNVTKAWNTMISKDLLGMTFNRAYTTWAKDNGWVDSPRKGVYTLGPLWEEMYSI